MMPDIRCKHLGRDLDVVFALQDIGVHRIDQHFGGKIALLNAVAGKHFAQVMSSFRPASARSLKNDRMQSGDFHIHGPDDDAVFQASG